MRQPTLRAWHFDVGPRLERGVRHHSARDARGVASLAYPQVSRYLALRTRRADFGDDMEATTTLTEIEQQKRLYIVELLLPHFGKNVDQLLEAATSVQEHISGLPRSPPCSTGHTE